MELEGLFFIKVHKRDKQTITDNEIRKWIFRKTILIFEDWYSYVCKALKKILTPEPC